MFFQGVSDYLSAVKVVLTDKQIRSWLQSVMIRSFFVAVLFFISLSVLGAWGIASIGASGWYDFGAFIYIIALIYFSGTVLGLMMAMGLPFLVQEGKLVKAFSKKEKLKAHKAGFKAFAGEIFSSVVSVTVSIIAWPFLLVPVLAPIGLVMMAWAYTRESRSTCRRIVLEFPSEVKSIRPNANSLYCVGLGLLPSFLSIFPFVALIAWPTLLVANLKKADDYIEADVKHLKEPLREPQ